MASLIVRERERERERERGGSKKNEKDKRLCINESKRKKEYMNGSHGIFFFFFFRLAFTMKVIMVVFLCFGIEIFLI